MNQQLARLGAEARVTNAGASSGAVQRSMITTHGARLERRHQPRRALARRERGRQRRRLRRDPGRPDRARDEQHRGRRRRRRGGKGQGGNGAIAGRTDEEIQIVFDRHKAELYRLYNRELRRDPTLRGQMILRMRSSRTAASRCASCAARTCARRSSPPRWSRACAAFDFGAKEGIGPVTILYPIDFLPAG